MILRARYVLAPAGRSIENGALRIAEGRIAEVGRAPDLTGGPVTDLGDCIVLPGFVNAHTHLELTHLAGRVPPRGDFVGWIERLVEAMRAAGDDPETIQASVRRGRELSLTTGVTALGDITRLPAVSRPVLAEGPLRAVSFGEVIAVGRLRDRLHDRLNAAASSHARSEFLQIGIAPHAPYTLEPDGIRACVERADRDGLRMCMHLAETAAEADFTRHLTGPIRSYFERHGIWDGHLPRPGLSPVEYAAQTGVLGPGTVLAHVNYVTDQEIELIAASRAHVAYCPRTHRAFDHPPHRFVEMLRRGINVCLGTDSLASNPSLSVLEELRFCRRRFPDIPGQTLIEMGTLGGARALGMSDVVGAIAPGMQADLAAVPFDPGGPADPVENVLVSSLEPIAVCVGGAWVSPNPPG